MAPTSLAVGALRELAGHRGVHTDGDRLYTIHRGIPREFDPRHSKLAALIRRGLSRWPFRSTSHVLYLGAATGTTARHVADIVPDGRVFAVELSTRSFRDLLSRSGEWPNIVPILGDAAKPDAYGHLVGRVDVVYQDIAQRNQAALFLRNLSRFGRPTASGILIVKARSIDVVRRPSDVTDEVTDEVGRSVTVLERHALEPYDADHGALVVQRR